MASELLKNKTLIQRLKEPDVPVVNFNLADSALDYSIESIEEELSTPTNRVADLADDLTPGPLRDELKGTFDPTQETYEEYLRRINARYGGRAKPKRGLVDEPGSYAGEFGQKYLYKHKDSGYRVMATKGDEKIYKTFPKNKLKEAIAYAKEVEKRFDKIEAKKPREVTGKKLTVYNKFAQDIHGKNFNDLTDAEKNIVKTRYKQTGGIFRKTFQTDALTELNQERIKKAFPDVEFEFKKGQKYGVVKKLKNGKFNPVFTAVRNFVNNDYKLSVRKALPVSTQRDIVANFELPKGVKEWNFDVKRGGNLYGIPDTAGANMNLAARIKTFVNEPKPYKIAADFGNPEGWLLSQMNRAYESKQNPNFIPKYDLINGKKKIVGFTDNQYGGGKTYYALKKYANKFNGTMMTEHPDFKNTKKYIDIAKKVKLAPNKVIKDLLIKGGVTDDRITLNNLLQYMINEKGVEPTKRGLVLHHKGGAFANPTRDFQILNTAVNNKIKGVELAMRLNPANITPKNIKFLKDAGASITIDGKTYGGGPKTAIGGFKQAEQFVQQKLEGFSDKDFKNLSKYLATLGCPGKAMGGRVGFQKGTIPSVKCIREGAKKINSGKIKSGAEARNFAKFANTAIEIGKISGKGLRAVAKFGVIPEMIIIGADTALRVGSGATFDEAILRAIDYIPGTGDLAGKADALELRRIDPANAETILNLRNFSNQKQKLDSLEQQKEADLALAGDDFAETNIGMTEQEIEKYYEPRIKEQESKVFESSISEPEELFALAKQAEFEDKRGVLDKQSPIGKFLDYYAEKPGVKQFVDLFATGVAREPDVSAQALKNYFADQDLSEEEEKFLRDTTKTSQGAKALLETLKQLEAGVDYPEGSVREKNLQDEERRLLFEAAKGDLALAERYFGPSATFGGEPIINRTDLEPGEIPMYDEEQIVDDIDRFKDFQMNRGIYSIGGRIGFKDGPKDPGRRMFLKLMTGIMTLPFVGKFIKPAAPVVQKLANTTTKMPDWFPNFIEKVMFKSSGKKVDADVMLHEVKELPGIKVYKQSDGKIRVEGENEYGKLYQIDYEPPGYQLVDESGKSFKTKGDFSATEDVPVNMDPDGNMDFDVEVLEDLDQILGSDTRIMEEFATGKKVEKMKSGEFALGKAEADLERAAEEAAFYDEID